MNSTLCDANVWLALALGGHVHHEAAVAWLDTVDDPGAVRFCRATQQALLRLLTNEAVLRPYGHQALTNHEAWAVYDAFVADDRIVLDREEPAGLDPRWREFSDRSAASPKLWMDAYLAAYAKSAGLQLVTTDRAFAHFDGLSAVVLAA